MRRLLLLGALLLGASPVAAQGLTVRMGETWLFAVRDGAPVAARKVAATVLPAPDQIKVSLRSMMGATMTMTNNSRFDFVYRARLVMPSGKPGAAKACAVPAGGRSTIEHWARPVVAVRLDRFRRAPAGSLCP